MHVVLYHDAVIPPPKYGGTERVLYWLSRALVSLSHNVTLIAREGSLVEGVNVIGLREKEQANWRHHIPKSADIVHLQATPRPPISLPFIVTIHGNGQPHEKFDPNTVFVSKRHAANHGSTHFVHNGIDPAEYICADQRDDYLVFLAKASWSVKNLKGAVQVARSAQMPLKIMGSRDWPLGIRRPGFFGVRYLGMVGDSEKRRILSRARALLFPVRWDEPFGLAITESLASGCPVFGTPYGSLPELVTPECGYLSARASDHIHALKEKSFAAAACRARVLENFTHIHMAKKYLGYYEKVLRDGTLGSTIPERISTTAPDRELLPWTF